MEQNGFKLMSPDVKNRYKHLFKPNNINHPISRLYFVDLLK